MTPTPQRALSGRNLSDVKFTNRAVIFRTIRDLGTVSRAELARRTNLNPATVSNIVRELLEKGLVEEAGLGESRGGRRPSLLRINPTRGYVIAISLERLAIRGMLTDLDLRETTRRTTTSSSLSHPADITLQALMSLIRTLVAESGVDRDKIIGIGIGVPGPLDIRQGTLISSPNFPAWDGTPLRRIIEEEVRIATFLDNDANVCALAEKWFGVAREMDDFVYILADTGVGGGIMIDGDICRGVHDIAGEIGHMTIHLDGPRCVCGNFGCLELYASPLVATELVRRAVAGGRMSCAVELVGGDAEKISFEVVVQAAQQGDALALEALDSITKALAVGISNVINTLDPEAVLVGGRISLAGDLVLDKLREIVAQRIMSGGTIAVPIILGELQREAPLIGAFCLVLRELFQNPEVSFAAPSFGPLPLHVDRPKRLSEPQMSG